MLCSALQSPHNCRPGLGQHSTTRALPGQPSTAHYWYSALTSSGASTEGALPAPSGAGHCCPSLLDAAQHLTCSAASEPAHRPIVCSPLLGAVACRQHCSALMRAAAQHCSARMRAVSTAQHGCVLSALLGTIAGCQYRSVLRVHRALEVHEGHEVLGEALPPGGHQLVDALYAAAGAGGRCPSMHSPRGDHPLTPGYLVAQAGWLGK
jgi:hypothetical protein